MNHRNPVCGNAEEFPEEVRLMRARLLEAQRRTRMAGADTRTPAASSFAIAHSEVHGFIETIQGLASLLDSIVTQSPALDHRHSEADHICALVTAIRHLAGEAIVAHDDQEAAHHYYQVNA